MKVSIVIPVYQGGRTISRLVHELIESLKSYMLEIVLVNDGSTDNSHDECRSLYKGHPSVVKYIALARNFGEHNAVMAGLNYVTGDYTVIIDDDFQNPPDEIKKLIEKAVEGDFDAVYSYYQKKAHSFFRNFGSSFNNLVASYLLGKPRNLYLSSFKCLDSFIVGEIVKYKGPFPYIDGLIWRSTKNIGKVLVKHDKREEGKSGYTFRKLVRLWMNMFVNFSIYPLRMSMLLGSVFSAIGVVLSVLLVLDKLTHPNIPLGITSILVAIMVFSGVQLVMLGLMGEYIGKLFLANNQTPQYTVRHIYGRDK